MRKLNIFLIGMVMALTLPSLSATEQGQVNQAARIITDFKALPEKSIPRHIMRNAEGFAILTVVKGGFIFSGKVGEGVVVARTGNGWSGPSFIRTGGAGFGPQAGGEVTEFVLVLNTPEAVRAFSRGENVQLGGALSVAAGPYGRTAAADVTPTAAIYTYSRSKGLFAGASLEGTVLITSKGENADYYGRRVSADSILNGNVSPPRGAFVLLRKLGHRSHMAYSDPTQKTTKS